MQECFLIMECIYHYLQHHYVQYILYDYYSILLKNME